MKVRLAVSDRLAANMKAERALAADRGDGWSSLVLPCDIHRVSGAQTKALELLKSEVSLMINMSLSLRLAGNMKRFRACMSAMVASRLQVLDGQPPADATAYRLGCIRLFLARGSHSGRRRALLWQWLNGDWREPSCIQHYIDPARPAAQNAPEVILRMVTRALILALAPRAPSTFPRHRWTGADAAVDEVGLLCCVHGLLKPTYLAFLVATGFAAARPFFQQAHQPQDDDNLAERDALQDLAVDEADDVLPEGDDEAQGGLDGDVGQGAADATSTMTGQVDWASLNAKVKKLGFAFVLMPELLSKMVILRQTVEPFRVLLSSHFRLASKAWEVEQLAKATAVGAEEGTSRQYRIVVAAMMSLELAFLGSVRKRLTDEREWFVLTSMKGQTVALRTLSFRLLSKAGCGVQELLADQHDKFPYKLFLLLEDPTLAEVFEAVKPCELDEFSKSFIKHFVETGLGLGHEDAIASLRCLAVLAKIDISHIEARHASVRRLLHASPQAKKPSAQLLSALWACTRLAKRQAAGFGEGVIPRSKPRQSPAAQIIIRFE